jgi:hypothetical protein
VPDSCPACAAELFGWLQLPAAGGEGQVLLQRCESCGLGIAADLARENVPSMWFGPGRKLADGKVELRVANRDSVQARLGGRHWAALDSERRLYPTPESLRGLAAASGLLIHDVRSPPSARGQAWMWQTILNALTFNENFIHDVRAGRLRAGSRPVRFAIDALVSTLAAIPVALVSAPLELVAALSGRGGELVAIASPAGGAADGRSGDGASAYPRA